MNTHSQLWLYFLVVSGVIILPGMDMAYVLGNSLTGGRRAGFAAVAGIVAGGIYHMVITATGVSIVLKLFPAAFDAMLIAGAAYVAWIGWSILRASSFSVPSLSKATRTPSQSFFGAMATNLLNPKAYIFMLAIFPQFIDTGDAARGSIWVQAASLWVITAATQIGVYGTLALTAGGAQSALAVRPKLNVLMSRAVGVILMAAASLTLFSGLASAHGISICCHCA